MTIGYVLVQFIFRLTFGVAAAMLVTSAYRVTSGFFRVHLWVLMGANTLAALALWTSSMPAEGGTALRLLAISLAVSSYAGAVSWLYENDRWGRRFLALVTLLGLIAAVLATRWEEGGRRLRPIPGARGSRFEWLDAGRSFW